MGRLLTSRLIIAAALALATLGHARAQTTPAQTPAPLPQATIAPASTQTTPQTSAPLTAPSALPTPTPRPVFQHQGVLVQKLNGETVFEQAVDQGYNPASAIKLATALVALRTLGPDHRFPTAVWTKGTFDQSTGTVNGDLIISGRDPSFHYEHAVLMARKLNEMGIRTVTGDLVVAPRFTMNFSSSALRSGESLYDTLDATRRPAAAVRAWYEERVLLGDNSALQTSTPSVAVMGAVYVDSVPAGARLLFTHKSSTLVDILKVLLCYSNNFMAERLGDTLGGASGVEHFLVTQLGIPATEIHLATTSGLGVNRLSPRHMMKVYRELLDELHEHGLSAVDILPVAGIDPGTLQRRFATHPSRGSIVAKTGTLIRTDGGASALVGQMRAQNGEVLLFVIFNQRGSVPRFRNAQDALILELQATRGGPKPFTYNPHALAMRLADTEFDTADSEDKGEYEPTPK
ncbi:MAG TPA: D-alanyl-D-alanine carboxypeptidase [Pyrinomonadaceae bacterium]|nr:D-alanyl-D-alanine carboxypeptidase [Pyrinomonadaceae bacterium]